jgi:hypothetical protein
MSTVLHVAIEVNAEAGAIRESVARKFFTSIFASGVGEGFGVADLMATPLFHTSFVPDLTHVNFLPDAVAVDPALVHLAPAFTAAKEGAVIKDNDRSSATRTLLRVITKRYQGAGKN